MIYAIVHHHIDISALSINTTRTNISLHTELAMNKNGYIIRLERKEEYRDVENLVRESFWNVYRPGCQEHYILKQLRDDPAFAHELAFVMEKDGKLIGQNIFVRTMIKTDDGRALPIMTMGPICIAPERKRQGYGKILLDYSLDKAMAFGCGAVCFEGNIDFTARADLPTRVHTASDIMDCRRE